MLSYQHGYHAGCFADVVKHVTLTRLLDYLTRKDKPLLYLETHSGRGMYDLQHAQALKTGEAALGIEPLWLKRADLPAVFKPYVDACEALNEDESSFRYYPGSPALAIRLLHERDRLVFCELHPQEFEVLRHLPSQGKRVFFSHSDGVKSLHAQLPPKERRGLIFIDPSYEVKSEYRDIAMSIQSAYQRFATGVYCLWYPLVDKRLNEQLTRGMMAIGAENYLRVEFQSGLTLPGMQGCGLWIINPPYVLKDELDIILKTLCDVFDSKRASYLIRP
jgi:23S rRNA (adenine2030-N6)-methyltransferase